MILIIKNRSKLMVKKNKEKEKKISVSETKLSEQKILREKIISVVNNKTNNKSQYLLFYLIKIFEKRKYNLISKEEIIQMIKQIYEKDPNFFITSNNEIFKTRQSLISTLVRIFNKICSKKNNLYKLNERATLKYLKKSLNTEENSAKTPYKIFIRKNEIKKEKISEEEDEIKIKKEEIKIKEEKEDNIKIKEEKKENEYIDNIDNMTIEIVDEKNEKNEKNLFELFNHKKLYDDFYLYLAEEGQFELLQEEIEKFMDKYKNNKLEENNKFTVLGIMGKIINVKNLLVELFKGKKDYENLSSELETKRNWFKYLIEVFYANVKTIKNIQDHSNLVDIVSGAKNLYKEDKERQNTIFDQMIIKMKELRSAVMESDKIKNDIIKEIELISEYFKKNNANIENINVFYEIVKNLINGKYSFIIREDISEDVIDKYNKFINMIEESLNLDNNI